MANKLELTWVGKEEKINPEPRILIEDKEKSYGVPNTENMLIHGDNLLALKALENKFFNKIQCIYIDPPFNTGARINADGEEIGYDDGLEHSIWLNLMKTRLEILKNMLTESGTIIVHLDDRECAYCKVIMDEIFGRENYINTITMSTNEPSGFKATGTKIFSTSNFLLVYSKNKSFVKINKVYIEKDYDAAYSKVFTKMEGHYKQWEWENIRDVVCRNIGLESYTKAKKEIKKEHIDMLVKEYALENYEKVFRTAAIGGGAKLKRQSTINLSKNNKNEIFVHEGEDIKDFYILNGEQILFYKNRFEKINNKLVPTQLLTDVWTDISWTGIANEGSVVFKNSKKPELLLHRILCIFTDVGDYVLDSFLGSGTTSSVAHKMNRKWIGIEMGNHCYSHCIHRIDNVIDGKDKTGISKIVNWQGGGGYKFYELAPTLVKQDEFGINVINEEYNAEMLASAVALHEGFEYKPSKETFWKQAQSTEKSFLYTTTNHITEQYLEQIVSELKDDEYLLIACKSFDKGIEKLYKNITIKKIPSMLLGKCEFGKDDYSLNIINPPEYEEEEDNE